MALSQLFGMLDNFVDDSLYRWNLAQSLEQLDAVPSADETKKLVVWVAKKHFWATKYCDMEAGLYLCVADVLYYWAFRGEVADWLGGECEQCTVLWNNLPSECALRRYERNGPPWIDQLELSRALERFFLYWHQWLPFEGPSWTSLVQYWTLLFHIAAHFVCSPPAPVQLNGVEEHVEEGRTEVSNEFLAETCSNLAWGFRFLFLWQITRTPLQRVEHVCDAIYPRMKEFIEGLAKRASLAGIEEDLRRLMQPYLVHPPRVSRYARCFNNPDIQVDRDSERVLLRTWRSSGVTWWGKFSKVAIPEFLSEEMVGPFPRNFLILRLFGSEVRRLTGVDFWEEFVHFDFQDGFPFGSLCVWGNNVVFNEPERITIASDAYIALSLWLRNLRKDAFIVRGETDKDLRELEEVVRKVS